MLGYVVLAVLGGVFCFCALFGALELIYRIRRRGREREREWQRSRDVIDGYSNGVQQLDFRERRRLVQRELDRLRR